MQTSLGFSGRVLLALGLAGGLVLPAHGIIDQKNPAATLSERAPAPAKASLPGKPESPKQDADGFWRIDFSQLASFAYGHIRAGNDDGFRKMPRGNLSLLVPDQSNIIDPPTEPGTGGTIPAEVQALDGKRVRLGGYMLPIKVEDGLATQFLILRNQMMCCFGVPPAPNEWVVVRLKGKGVPSRMDTPLYFYGTLHVGEIFEQKVFEGLYELDVEKVSDH